MGVSHLWAIIQAHLDEYGVREAAFARRVKESPQTLNSRKLRGFRELPKQEFLEAVARETRTPYRVVLDAVLRDIGYLPEEGDSGGDTTPTSVTIDEEEANGVNLRERERES